MTGVLKRRGGRRHTQRDYGVRTQGLDGHLRPRRAAPEETSPADPRSHASSPQDCGRTNFCCLSRLAFGASLAKLRTPTWRPLQTPGDTGCGSGHIPAPGDPTPRDEGPSWAGAPRRAEGRAGRAEALDPSRGARRGWEPASFLFSSLP